MTHEHPHALPIEKPANNADTAAKERFRAVMRVTLIGSFFDLLLGIAKIIGGYVGSSAALIADGVHSLSDLFTDFIVIYAAKHSHREADEEHPYGHGRIETLATVGLGLALFGVAVGITWDAVERLFQPEKLWQPGYLAMSLAGASIVIKEALYHYSMTIARKYRSNMLKANAWHSRTDAISSVVVVIGIAGSMAGLNYLDAIAAVGVALMIAKISWDLGWHSVRELIDTGLEPERVNAIRKSILAVDGVKTLHILRTRRMGSDALVDVHIQVAPELSVSEGHQISEFVRQQVIRDIDEVADVMVHIDPEDDEEYSPNVRLPLRQALLTKLGSYWHKIPESREIEDVTLHYLEGKIKVDLLLPLSVLRGDVNKQQQLKQAFDQVTEQVSEVDSINLIFH
jgi:cation diffusion facilitator family transporter